MNVSNVKAFVWTLPNTDLVHTGHDYSTRITSRQSSAQEAEIALDGTSFL